MYVKLSLRNLNPNPCPPHSKDVRWYQLHNNNNNNIIVIIIIIIIGIILIMFVFSFF